MTLPDSEKLIILPASEVNRIDETFTESVCGLVTPYVRAAVSGEACLWYERMGKFAEWVVDNGWKRVNFIYKDIKWYNTEQRRQASHAELIELFINSLSVGFSQHKPQVESVEAGNADKGLDLKKLEEQVDTALAGEDLDR